MPVKNAGMGGFKGVTATNVGFVLSFIDNASPQIKSVTKAYNSMVDAMDATLKLAKNTAPFERGLTRIAKALRKVSQEGYAALGTLGALAAVVQGGVGKVNINVINKVPKLAKGGIVTRPTTALIGERGPEAVIPLNQMKNIVGQGMSFMMNIKDQTTKLLTKMFQDFRRISKEWSKSFGEKAPDQWKKISKSGKEFSETILKFLKAFALLDFAKKVDAIHQSLQNVAGSKTVENVTESVSDLRDSLYHVQKTLNLSSKEFTEFRKSARRASLDGAKSLKDFARVSDADIGGAIAALNDAGVRTKEEFLSLAPITAKIAKSTGMDFESVAQVMVQFKDRFKQGREGAEQLMATMANLAAKNKIDFATMSEGVLETSKQFEFFLTKATPKQVNEFMNSQAKVRAALSNNFRQVDELNAFISEGIKNAASDQGVATAALLGMNERQFKSMVKNKTATEVYTNVLKRLNKVGGASTTTIAAFGDAIGFNDDMIRDLQPGIAQAIKDLNGMKNASVKAGDATKFFDNKLDNSMKTEDKVKTTMGNLIGHFGLFGVTVNDVHDSMKNIGFMELYAQMMIVKEAVKLLPDAFDLAKHAIIGIGSVASKIIPTLLMLGSKVLPILAGAMEGIGVALEFMLGPWGLIILGVVALTIGIIALWKNCAWFRDLVMGLWEILKGFAVFIWGTLVKAFEIFLKYWWLFTGPIGLVIKGIQLLWGLFSKTPGGQGFIGWIKKGIESLMTPLGWLWDRLKGIWEMFFAGKGTPHQAAPSAAPPTGGVRKEATPTTPTKPSTATVTSSDGSKTDVELNQDQVVVALDRIASLLVDIRDHTRRTVRTGYSIEDAAVE